MAFLKNPTTTFIFLFLASSSSFYSALAGDGETSAQLQTYIVHVEQPEAAEDRDAWYLSFLPGTFTSSGEPRIIHSYSAAFSGFAAKLTRDEVDAMESKDGFLQAYPDRLLPLLTTHTPDFLGLQVGDGLWRDSRLGEGLIIGVLDTGITPMHPSFNDHGIPPPPPKWRGECHLPAPFSCNNKIIGAKSFVITSKLPIDQAGHGTHTAATAAGNFVDDAAFLGNANGTAAGMAPRAHLAIYKVCGLFACSEAAIIAGMDAAIADGVDVMSLSLGGDPIDFFRDSMAIAAFSATAKGIFVSCSGGNGGPHSRTVSNAAPWILTVAASTMDRSIRATVRLGNGHRFYGQGLYQSASTNFTSGPLKLVLPENAACDRETLNKADVKGKMVICMYGRWPDSDVKQAGAAAMITINDKLDGYTTFAEDHVLPTSHVSYRDGTIIREYVKNSTKINPTAEIIFEGTKFGANSPPAPAVASFSSRGPNMASPGILKPDVTGPGVNVLAAWLFPIGNSSGKAAAAKAFNIISGTSMSTPHLSGIAALVKSRRRDWSPAAIKSAIMTTSDALCKDGKPIRDERMKPASFFAMGAGHVNPLRASDPGLVYDLKAGDYVPYLCGLGYSDKQASAVVGRRVRCADEKSIAEHDLNYPSIVVSLGKKAAAATVKRTVRNVGDVNSTYVLEVEMPEGVAVGVRPERLQFSGTTREKEFEVMFTRSGNKKGGSLLQGNLKLVSGSHVVRSPILVTLEK